MDTVECTISGRGVATIRFNRPDKANSFDQPMLDRLVELVEGFGDDARVRVVVLTGAGRHFSAGASIGEGPPPDPTRKRRLIIDVCAALDACPKPIVAVVQGACIGGALAFACCCDALIAGREAVFSIPEVRLGFAPGPLTPFFVRGLGHRAVRHYLLSGERFSGADALRLGLAHKLVETAALDAALAETIDALLLGGPTALARAKAVMRQLAPAALPHEALLAMQKEHETQHGSAEAQEGRASFKEKRKPSWYPA